MLNSTFGKTSFICLFLLVMNGVFVDTDVMKSVSVMEGDSVTLNTDVTDIQTNDLILWMFGSQETRIAEIIKQSISIYDRNDERFRDRLQLNNQTGSLTIRNTRITDSGLYKAQIISNKGNYKRFNVTVYARLSIPVITRDSPQCSSSSERSSSSKCVLLCSVNVTQVTLSWYKGNSLLSSISVSDLNTLSLPLEVEYQDTNTYSCVVNNPITNQTKHLNITDLCQLCSDASNIKMYLGAFIAGVLAVLAGVMYCLYRKHRRTGQKGNCFEPSVHAAETVQTEEDEVHYSEPAYYRQNMQKKKADVTDETIYSSVAT